MALELPLTGTTAPPERGDAARNRARVIEAAEKLFCGGVERVDMRDIAAQAGVGVGTLYRRFGDKASLVGNVLDRRATELQEAILRGPAPLGPGAPPEERLLAFLDALVDHTEAELTLIRALDDLRPGARFSVGPYPAWRLHVMVLLEQIGGDYDPAWSAEALLAPLSPGLYAHQRRERGLTTDDIKRHIAGLARAVYGSRA
jgi:AcrR family transcriptional regulator